MRRTVVVLAVVVLGVTAATVAGAAADQQVSCTLSGDVLTCPLPERPAVTSTVTATATVTQPPVTVTATQTVTQTASATITATSTPTTTTGPATGSWWSGQSDTVTTLDGSFAAWRGRAVEVGGTWSGPADQFDAPNWQVGNKYQGQPNRAAYANISRVDYAMEPFKSGETWAQAAAGNFDARWTQHIQALKTAWGSRDPGGMFIRFAWEANGDWFPWKITAADVANSKTAWVRYANLVRQHFPGAQITWSPNWGSNAAYTVDSYYPGSQYVDVIGVDFYNQWPWDNTQAALNTKWAQTGAVTGTTVRNPMGPEAWRQWAAAKGKPLAFPEWGNDGQGGDGSGGGDSVIFFTHMNTWLKANSSQTPQAGKVLYEVLFNTAGLPDKFSLFPVAAEPTNTAAAAEYARLW